MLSIRRSAVSLEHSPSNEGLCSETRNSLFLRLRPRDHNEWEEGAVGGGVNFQWPNKPFFEEQKYFLSLQATETGVKGRSYGPLGSK